jgi:hypothetical protein
MMIRISWLTVCSYDKKKLRGVVSEWLKEHAWKACNGESHSRVRISPTPPSFEFIKFLILYNFPY